MVVQVDKAPNWRPPPPPVAPHPLTPSRTNSIYSHGNR